MKYGKIVLYKEWLCTLCGEAYPHRRSLPKSGKPTNCETCYFRHRAEKEGGERD